MLELVRKRLELMGQAVFKIIYFPCNYSGAKLALQEPGRTQSRPACHFFYRVVPNVVTKST